MRVSFIAETPNSLFKKVTKNFDNDFISEEFSQNKVNLFIHIGESTSSMNWSLYKYFRNTNPKLSKLEKDKLENKIRSTDVNVLLNRVRNNQKNESRKKLYFSAVASTGLILFGLIIF